MSNKTVGEYVNINTLTPHPKNPRSNDHAVDAIANSIKRFGFTSPIIANADGTILAGHTRFKAAKQLGLISIPVVHVDLNPTDAELLMIADNKLGEKADWNDAILSDLLTNLSHENEDLSILGFDEDELDQLLNLSNDPSFMDFGFDGLGDSEIDDQTQYKENMTTLIIEIPDEHINLLEIKQKLTELCEHYSINMELK